MLMQRILLLKIIVSSRLIYLYFLYLGGFIDRCRFVSSPGILTESCPSTEEVELEEVEVKEVQVDKVEEVTEVVKEVEVEEGVKVSSSSGSTIK